MLGCKIECGGVSNYATVAAVVVVATVLHPLNQTKLVVHSPGSHGVQAGQRTDRRMGSGIGLMV